MDLPTSGLSMVVLTNRTDPMTEMEDFLAETRTGLERALVARFGVHDGVDAAAEAVAYAVEKWPLLEQMNNPAGYLFRVGQTHGNRLRRRKRRQHHLVNDPQTADTPVDLDLQAALMKLKPAQRVAVVLVHAHGHTYAEAASILDVPLTTVTNHLTRGLARLHRILESS